VHLTTRAFVDDGPDPRAKAGGHSGHQRPFGPFGVDFDQVDDAHLGQDTFEQLTHTYGRNRDGARCNLGGYVAVTTSGGELYLGLGCFPVRRRDFGAGFTYPSDGGGSEEFFEFIPSLARNRALCAVRVRFAASSSSSRLTNLASRDRSRSFSAASLT